MKNPKPNVLTIYISLCIAASLSAVVFLLGRNVMHAGVVFLAAVVISYFFIYNALQKFIYRKIKLIYKSIHNLKLGKDVGFGEYLSDDPINDVEQEVAEWAITKRKEIDELKRMEKFRKEFLANVSHELKTPLFSLQGYIHTLIDGADEDPEVRKKFLQKSADNVERLCNLVDDLSEISQLERGEVSMAKETFDINKLVKEVFEALEPQASQRQISFSIKKGCDAAFYVLADREKTRQVITNLVVNSIKYGRDGGETIVGFYDMDENILTEVSDNGIGISEEHLPRLFERFYRVDKHRSRDAGGTGLGLAIVKHLVESQGGTINVRSTPGIGSTFGFTLPKSKEK
ncbi:MAG: ATP-binding protein [Chitinophagales bacterium]|nr:ATP-binding protein [Chitinophagales bacterium]MDW8418914.1 ATP-binding protein [Chitinophagales bacterium]